MLSQAALDDSEKNPKVCQWSVEAIQQSSDY